MKKSRGLPFFLTYSLVMIGMLVGICLGNRAVTVLSESIPIQRGTNIIIDAGHGGEDGGTTSCTGRPESAYNLEIALRLNDLLHFLGYRTTLVRSTDVSVYTSGDSIAQKKISDLKERVRICNETENALLVSIHQNHFSDSRYSGAQVFYAGTEGSSDLARAMQQSLVQALNPGSNRQEKQADGVYLMEQITCPGILIECGFLSNPEEEAKLSSPEYQMALCCVIASTLSQFLAGA